MTDLREALEHYVDELERDTLVTLSEFANNARVAGDLRKILEGSPSEKGVAPGLEEGRAETTEQPGPVRDAAARVQLIGSNGDATSAGHIGDRSIYATIRVECDNGAVVIVAADGSVATTTVAEELARRWAELRSQVIPAASGGSDA